MQFIKQDAGHNFFLGIQCDERQHRDRCIGPISDGQRV